MSKVARGKEENTASRKSIASGNQRRNGHGHAWRRTHKEKQEIRQKTSDGAIAIHLEQLAASLAGASARLAMKAAW